MRLIMYKVIYSSSKLYSLSSDRRLSMRCLALTLVLVGVCAAQAKPRVYITTSDAWSMAGGFAVSDGTGGGVISGGSSPQTVELIQNFMKSCSSVIVTNDRNNANYVILFDRDSAGRAAGSLAAGDWSGIFAKVNKIAVFRRNGDALYSGKTRSVSNAVKDSCSAIRKPN